MAKLNNHKRKEFTKSDFDNFPIWVWDEEMEYKLPLDETEPSRYEYGVFFIKANFTVSNHRLDGYLIGNMIFSLLKCDRFELFPLNYNSPVSFKEIKEISGVLDFRFNKRE